MKTNPLKKVLNIFRLDPEKVPPNIAKRPYVILLISALVGWGSIHLLIDGFSSEHDLSSLIGGLFGLGCSIAGLYLWASIVREKVE